MTRISTAELSGYLLSGRLGRRGCLIARRIPFLIRPASKFQARPHFTKIQDDKSRTPPTPPRVPFRKQQKDQAKTAKVHSEKKKKNANKQTVPGWELTVGIEIHAQLNTARKLFSPAATSFNDMPNSHVALFDVAMPGSQPAFQPETLIPAVRAALALGCTVSRVSRFDRKHYFHWDQPAGYQITQYYEPFAKGGRLELRARDGIAAEEPPDGVTVSIKQVQMEQDTGKTSAQPDEVHWIDFNRAGAPLIEIITEPEIHHPATAAAFVRKVQMLLHAVNACVSGMETGGLRADVNVSVRRSGEETLGTRTEIKNLSSFKAVEDAIIAERDRQIALLEAGGVVEGETRGWSLGSTETRRLRGKEGEVDYRYMPDPDLGPVVVDDALVRHLAETMGTFPDVEIDQLVGNYGLSTKDALSLMLLDNGARVQYFYNVLDALEARLGGTEGSSKQYARLAANWCLHELGKLTELASDLQMTPEGDSGAVPSSELADILAHLHRREITAKIAKELLWRVFRAEITRTGVTQTIDSLGLWFHELTEEEYAALADEAFQPEQHVVKEFVRFREGKAKGYPNGKLMFLVGRMMMGGPTERMDPAVAERVMRTRMEEVYVPAAIAGASEGK
ncbi:GatB/GatE catalytic domain-containing protein [Apodospora peruviana]|uniref:Glutamyl-tRNA(Gln) amidotransferase subunit B, mitochondrial n=1 Tax=Apodospora peruviana TaxID=516989 RepID=A0AAE0HVC4_9PEZI|nr:GatB/GatE catalytic domain-containing protein [Apodospora peruviana]